MKRGEIASLLFLLNKLIKIDKWKSATNIKKGTSRHINRRVGNHKVTEPKDLAIF